MDQAWLEKDFYKTLGVAKNASADDIKKSYRKLAKELHPDANQNNPRAEERFKEVSEAYDVIGNAATRREYDEAREMFSRGGAGAGGFQGGPGFGGFPGGMNFDLGDLFGGMFGGGGRRPQRGSDLETRVTLSFADALRGVTTPLRLTGEQVCEFCRGSGAKQGTQPTACKTCRGTGNTQRNVGGFAMAEPCRDCRGTGKFIEHPCPDCRGVGAVHATRTVQVKIPAGVKDGSRIRLAGRGGPGALGGPAGDLFVVVEVTPHPVFGRKDDHLTITVPITIDEAAMGATVPVPVVSGGSVSLKIPAATPHGKTFRIKERGVPTAKGKPGDLLVTVEIAVPQKLSKQAKQALEDFAKATADEDPREELLQRAARAPRIEPEP
jgi:molecular chaperone DnaJ